jgi:hypothetical protein
MTHHFRLFICFLFTVCNAFAQGPEVKLGTPYPVIDAPQKYYFSKNNEVLAVKIDKKKYVLQKLSTNKLTEISRMTYEDFPKGFSFERIMEYHGRYYILYTLDDKKEKVFNLYSREIDFAKGTFIDLGKKLLSIKDESLGFEYNSSFDETELLIKYRVKPEKRNDNISYDIIGFNVFDENLSMVWQKEVTMPYTEKKMNNIDYSIDNKGNAYILTTVYDDNTTREKKRGEEKANYHIELLKVEAQTGTINIAPVQVDTKFISKIWLFDSAKGYMTCSGFYDNGSKADAVDGIFFFKVNAEGKIYDLKSFEIPLAIINQYINERAQRKNEKSEEKDEAQLRHLELKKIITEEDGSLLLIGQQEWLETRTVTTTNHNGGTTTRTYYIYHADDLLVTKVDPSGRVDWMKKIPKRQTSSFYMGSRSYQYIKTGKSYTFFFLDTDKNDNLSMDQFPARAGTGPVSLTAYALDHLNGVSKRIKILNIKDVQGMELYQYANDRILQIDEQNIVIEFYKKKKQDILVNVKLQD